MTSFVMAYVNGGLDFDQDGQHHVIMVDLISASATRTMLALRISP